MRKVDAFTHIWPRPYYDALLAVTGTMTDITMRSEKVPMMTDLDIRFEIMDLYDDYCQILSLASPPLELVASPQQAVDLARIGTDSMAELCARYPERFPAFIATPPMGSGIEAIIEASRYAIKDAGAVGVQIYSHINGRPIDEAEFAPFFDFMAECDLPVWIHPARGAKWADYPTEDKSKYEIWWTFGWPYETSAAMARLVFSKTFDRLPDLKIITHHGGGMVPFFEGRVGPGWDVLGARTSDEDYGALLRELKHRPIDYFRKFYADTALFGGRGATRCALDFFGSEHIIFASDAPFDPEGGRMFIRQTIELLDTMDLPAETLAAIYHGNIGRLTNRTYA